MMIDWGQVITAEDKEQAAAEAAREAARETALRYLAETDWYVIRASDTGKSVPKDIAKRRAEARKAAGQDT